MANITLKQVADVIGEEGVQKLIAAFPGGDIYIRNSICSVEERNKRIVDDYYSGLDRGQLALKYDLSISAINNAIRNSCKPQHTE